MGAWSSGRAPEGASARSAKVIPSEARVPGQRVLTLAGDLLFRGRRASRTDRGLKSSVVSHESSVVRQGQRFSACRPGLSNRLTTHDWRLMTDDFSQQPVRDASPVSSTERNRLRGVYFTSSPLFTEPQWAFPTA